MDFAALLYEEESDTLDFKRNQYKFVGASDEEKGELLKDILAFANAWRRSDAYILIGVSEVKGGKSEVVGLEADLDDAAIQQFVNSKTQKPVRFSYLAVPIDGKRIGVIHIPSQERPIFLKSNYGALKSGVVYLRRGTTTATADPDEVFAMGRAQSDQETAPNLEVRFADLDGRRKLEVETSFDVEVLSIDKASDIPDFTDPAEYSPMGRLTMLTRSANSDYYRKLVRYYYNTLRSRVVGFAITNPSSTLASDVRIEIQIPRKNDCFELFDPDDLPKIPHAYSDTLRPFIPSAIEQFRSATYKADVEIEGNDSHWIVGISYSKVQPKQTLFSKDAVAIGFRKSCQLECAVKIYADNLPTPIESSLVMKAQATHSDGGLTAVEERHKEYLKNWLDARKKNADQ